MFTAAQAAQKVGGEGNPRYSAFTAAQAAQKFAHVEHMRAAGSLPHRQLRND